MEPASVLTFWFEEIKPEQWFKKDVAFDELVRHRFELTYEQAKMGELVEWRTTPEGRVAEIVVLDQLPRNMYRGTPHAFATDAIALERAQEAVLVGDDLKVSSQYRPFLYMPYMHSESKEVHVKALELFEKLGNESNLRYEIEHKAIIDRFGRYPSGNEILGRESSSEELEFLKTHKGF